MMKWINRIVFFFMADIVFLAFIASMALWGDFSANTIRFVLFGAAGMVAVRIGVVVLGKRVYYDNRIEMIKNVLEEYKKGRFIAQKQKIGAGDDLGQIYGELRALGKHLNSVITTQKNEIDKFQDLYNSIVFSISTYYMILNEEDKIVFANNGLCSKFHFDQNDVIGKRIDEIFYFVNRRLVEGIRQVRKYASTALLEKTHLLSVNKVSIIADIKIATIVIQEKRHEIVIIDDVTNKLQKDYQISLMSQISESIQKDEEIDRILHTILTGVTSGSGLGFNRAMLFLLEGNGRFLQGKMAVGPDSFEEAIEIWSAISSAGNTDEKEERVERRSGKMLLETVLATRLSMEEENIFTQSIRSKKYLQINDLWGEANISEVLKKLIDVKEFVVVPLVAVNRPIGLIVADNKFNKAPISRNDIELLSIFASQAALSIENYVRLDSVTSEMEKISQRQEAIVESEKLAAIGRISAHIAHEIRNPLVTMGGYARRIYQLAKDKEKDRVKEIAGIKEAAKIILKESERLEKILSNVMDFTRPARYIREFNNVNDVIVDTVNLLKNLFLEKKIQVKMNLMEDIPLVKCDFNQMKQVILNLLQNAIDVLAPEGTVTLSTETSDVNVIIRVADSGEGIEHEDPNIVFEPFFTTKVTGVGLGLAIVKRIIKDHGGDISVSKVTDGGTEFTIELPLPI